MSIIVVIVKSVSDNMPTHHFPFLIGKICDSTTEAEWNKMDWSSMQNSAKTCLMMHTDIEKFRSSHERWIVGVPRRIFLWTADLARLPSFRISNKTTTTTRNIFRCRHRILSFLVCLCSFSSRQHIQNDQSLFVIFDYIRRN